jgi:cysteine desulfurase
VGILFKKSTVEISPIIFGGGQEKGLRSGTENVPLIVGMAKALSLAYDHLEAEKKQILGVKTYMIDQLKKHVPGVLFNGDPIESSLYTVLNVSFPPAPFGEMLLFKLDIAGISASGGSACSSGSSIGSHVLAALKPDPARPNVRFSFGRQNTNEEIDYVVSKLAEMFNSLQSA